MRPIRFTLFATIVCTGVGAVSLAGAAAVAQVTVHQRIVIRIPRIRDPRVEMRRERPVRWREKKADHCQRAGDFVGAAITDAHSVDLMLRNGERLRVKLGSDCPALDFYSGFYMTPGSDGMVCADRDVIRSRAGGSCDIESFRQLKLSR